MGKLVCTAQDRMEEYKILYLWQTFWKNRRFAIDSLISKKIDGKTNMFTSDNVLDCDIKEFSKYVEEFNLKIDEPQ